MNRDYYSNSNDYINRWVISYADFITMLLALFMVLYAANAMGTDKIKDINESVQSVFKPAVQTNVKNPQNSSAQTQEAKKPESASESILETEAIIKKLNSEALIPAPIKILKEQRGVVIRLNDTMLFDQGSAIIKPEAMAVLDKIAVTLDEFKNPVVIEGHTDAIPIKNAKYPSNWELSTARATNIISYLTQKHKFTPGRLSAMGYGEYMPVAKNDSSSGRAKNRRVDIIILSSELKN